MPDYTKTIIYKLINYDCPDLVYVGSTTNFTKRKHRHKQNTINCNTSKVYSTIRDNGGWESWNMIKICDYPCNSSIEARQEEDRQMLKQKATLNSCRAYTSEETKKTEKKEYDNEYRENNKDKKKEYDKQYCKNNKGKKKNTTKSTEKQIKNEYDYKRKSITKQIKN